jgi:hypothetical protein
MGKTGSRMTGKGLEHDQLQLAGRKLKTKFHPMDHSYFPHGGLKISFCHLQDGEMLDTNLRAINTSG